MSVALKGADSHLGSALWGSSHHVDGIIHQRCFSLKEEHSCYHPSVGITNPAMHLSHHDCWRTCTAPYGFSKNSQKMQLYFYKLHGKQSIRQPQSATVSTIWWAILSKVPFWLYTQSESNMVNCYILWGWWGAVIKSVLRSCAAAENRLGV